MKKRYGQIIRLKPEMKQTYLNLHADPWPCVLKKISECNIRNYSIFLAGDNILFAYFEYIGADFEADMKSMAEDECTRRWWKETAPCQESLSENPEEWWLNLEEVFHCG